MSKPARRIQIPDQLADALAPYVNEGVFNAEAFRLDCEDASDYLQQWDAAHPEELEWILNLGHPVEDEDNRG